MYKPHAQLKIILFGANAPNVSFEFLYGGNFTLWPQLVNPAFYVRFPTDAAPQFLSFI